LILGGSSFDDNSTGERAIACTHRLAPGERQPFSTVFLFAVANGLGALPAFIAAQHLFAASAIAFRAVALSVRFGSTGDCAGKALPDTLVAGRLLTRLAGPWRARIAACVSLEAHDGHGANLSFLKEALGGARYFFLSSSSLIIFPPFITNLTRCSSVMSVMGSPETAIRSAYFPLSIDPICSCQPITVALIMVPD
jgi:hypothetical protein